MDLRLQRFNGWRFPFLRPEPREAELASVDGPWGEAHGINAQVRKGQGPYCRHMKLHS